MAHLFVAGVALLVLALLGHWALVLSEGVYLGPRVVVWLYDRIAQRYDGIKNLDPRDDAAFLARPLMLALDGIAEPLVLDVGTGTGRMALALLVEADFDGRVVGLDRSALMMSQAQPKLAAYGMRGKLLRADAGKLPFPDASFDAVTCLEALEFTARPKETLREMVRVLRPGGTLLTSNRVGSDALWYPGRHCGRGRVEALLRALGMVQVEAERWQTYYDLIWAKKPDR